MELDDCLNNIESLVEASVRSHKQRIALEEIEARPEFTSPLDYLKEYHNKNEVLEPAPEEAQVGHLSKYLAMCDLLHDKTLEALGLLDDLERQHTLVSSKTTGLHDTCMQLLEEQTRLDMVVKDIETPFRFFKVLDEVGPKLGLTLSTALNPHPVEDLNLSKDIFQIDMKGILADLDTSVEFLKMHPGFRDYGEYALKFRQMQGMCFCGRLVCMC